MDNEALNQTEFNKLDALRVMQGYDKLCKLLRETHVDFPATALHCLVCIMLNEGISQVDMQKKIDMPKSTCSRNTRLLTERLGPDRAGMGLAELRLDPKDWRSKGIFLTEKGKKLKEEFIAAMIG